MKRCFIFGAGDKTPLPFLPNKDDVVIAADGGYRYALENGIKPTYFIGDLDSLEKAPIGVEKTLLPTVKDDTDSLAAAKKGLNEGADVFCFFGCSGGRPDHTHANLTTLAMLSKEKKTSFMFFDGYAATAITSGGGVSFAKREKGFFSVFAWGEKSKGVTISGAKYVIKDEELTPFFPLGVSNEFIIDEEAEITVEDGTLLVTVFWG